jgi:hypothetical protein
MAENADHDSATALAAMLLVSALVLVGCAGAPSRPQLDRSVGHPPPVSVIPPLPRLRPGLVIPWRPVPPVKQRPTLSVPGCRDTDMSTELTWQGLHGDSLLTWMIEGHDGSYGGTEAEFRVAAP